MYKWEMSLRGIEPPHPAPEAGALSTELQTHRSILLYSESFFKYYLLLPLRSLLLKKNRMGISKSRFSRT